MAERKGITVNLETAKSLVDWVLRLAPFALFLVQFYINQDRTVDRTKQDDDKIRTIETRLNEMQRQISDAKAEAGALKQHVEDQEKFYVLTSAPRR